MSNATIVSQNTKISHPACTLNRLHRLEIPKAEENFWVKLATPLNPYSHDEALLLCQASESECTWIAWVPDHGEAILHVSQFV